MAVEGRPVDAYVNNKELSLLGKKKTECLMVSQDLLTPAYCMSKQGRSTSAMFSGHKPGSDRPRSATSIHDYAREFVKQGGTFLVDHFKEGQGQQQQGAARPASAVSRLEALSSDPPPDPKSMPPKPAFLQTPSSPADAKALDRQMQRKAVRDIRAKYLVGQLATKYGVKALTGPQGLALAASALGAGVAPAAAVGGSHSAASALVLGSAAGKAASSTPVAGAGVGLGISVVPSSGFAKEVVPGAGDAASAQKVVEMAMSMAAAAAAEREKRARADAVLAEARRSASQSRASREVAAIAKDDSKYGRRRPGSAAFRATSRDQAQRTGTRFVESGGDAPGPGRYNVKYGLRDHHVSGTYLAGHSVGRELKEKVAKGQQQGAGLRGEDTEASQDVGGGGGTHGGGQRARSASPPMRAEESTLVRSPSRGATRSPGRHGHEDPAALAAEQTTRTDLQGGGGGGSRPPYGAVLSTIFRDAHKVHDRPTSAPGTQPFKAVPRPSLRPATASNQLALCYWQDGYDELTRKAPKQGLDFGKHVSRQPPSTGADTPVALGPGAYLHGETLEQNPTYTGRHVSACHKGIRNVPTFDKTSARPGSAPPRSLSAGPGARRPISAARQAAYEEAVHVLYGGDGGEASADMLGVRVLQAEQSRHYIATHQHLLQQHGHSHPQLETIQDSEGASVDGEHPYGYGGSGERYDTHPHPTLPGGHAANAEAEGAAYATYAAAAVHGPIGDQAEAAAAGESASRIGLGPQQVQKYSSTGFTSRVKGGKMSQTTRATECRSLRVVASGKVIPPASCPQFEKLGELNYDPDFMVQGHRRKAPEWKLPPNRTELSKNWVSSVALAFL